MADVTTAPPLARADRLVEALRLLYLPWTYLVFVPALALTTLVLGVAAMVVAPIDQRLSNHCGALWAWLLCRANLTRVRVRGRENVARGQSFVIMSNHQSHFDVLAFYGHWGRQFRWVIKKELRSVPILGPGCKAQGHIFIDRSDRERAIASLREAQEHLLPGASIMIFPEGSRSRDGRLGELKKGGFMMAYEMGLPILPVSITGTHRVLPPHRMMLLPGSVEISVHPPIDPAAYGVDGRDRLMADVRRAIASGLADGGTG
jgi:1-acyl-sn-glycerol-3-phosphate acyltransferase